MLLAGDIGGTKSNLAIFSSEAEIRKPVLEATFPSAQYSSLEELIHTFLSQNDVRVEAACFGVAGPVIEGKAKVTNLPWELDKERLQRELKIPAVHLMNDLDAMAHAIPLLEAEDVYTLNEGQPEAHGTLAVIAPGTGLGEAFLTWNGTRYQAFPSEGGHADFAPTNEAELDLLRYLWKRYGHVSYELVCSGKGLPNVYAYMRECTPLKEHAWVTEQLDAQGDHTPLIVQAALDVERVSERSQAAVSMLVAILGAEAGNLALKVLATGGVYLGGGIPPRILSYLKEEQFMQSFKNKGRFAEMMTNIPVHVVLNPKLALLGAACRGFEI
ncbi:glucokinase [Ktedonosporobacter rubrisoli]|uniref:Glucokinase n=1 Tax=Ktedonosporobacter rubrisoli TaxID=2509675 RepID=A0A4P6JQK8_KTERU|nr:glucokinase [Ktedonosporobacter rubrisoli]QBD77709.1 glucokinase [Ktedonosporobacter rubrisoli]